MGEELAWAPFYIMQMELKSRHRNVIEASNCLSHWSVGAFLVVNGFGLINYGRLVLNLYSRPSGVESR